jgi:hypothetical protein
MSHSEHANRLVSAQDIQEYFDEYNKLFTELHNKLVSRIKDKLDHADNFIEFVGTAIQLLSEEAVSLHGFQKKELVIDLVKGVVEAMDVTEEEKEKIRKSVFPTLDNTVDLFIAAAKGYMFLRKAEQHIEDACSRCQARCIGKCSGCRHKTNKVKTAEEVLEAPRNEEGGVDITGLSNVVYDKLRSLITHKQVTISSIIGIVTLAMQLVQQFAGVSGEDKKKIVISVINRLIEEFPMSDEDRLAIKAVVATTLDKTIDFVIAIANGEIDLLGVIEDTVARCKLMCGC